MSNSVVRGQRKERLGEVISNKMTKTIVVRVERRFRHPKFKKVVTRYRKFYAHDEKSEAKVGDRVRIEETRPLSKMKSWRLVEVLERNKQAVAAAV
ncbi:MAG: 30S ribosomal protein S17 [Verrucomicrobia bacterium]|nr:30S ribosomal protein S17 [Verrucomicrobiota bacterium]